MTLETVVALLGVTTYESTTTRSDDRLGDIPQVASNLTRLEAMLGSGLLGPDIEVRRLLNPHSSDEAAAFIVDAASTARGLFLLYYAGHGLRTSSGSLALTHSESTLSSADYRALDYDKVRHACLRSTASRRVVILDCCYSGTAIRGLLNEGDLQGQLEITRSCVIASSPSTRPSHVVAGEDYTAFTGRLLDSIDTILEQQEDASITEVVAATSAQLLADGLPSPQMADRNSLSSIRIFHRPRVGSTGESRAERTSAPAQTMHSGMMTPEMSGLSGIYRDFNDEDNRSIVGRIRKARSIFFIAHTGYNAMVSQYQGATRDAIQNGCRLRVVVSDPYGPLMQSSELTTRLCPSIQQVEEIQQVLQACSRHQQAALKYGHPVSNVQARVYKGAPSVNILFIDRWMRMIPYLPLIDAGESPVFEFDFADPNRLSTAYTSMLDNLWNGSRAVDLDVYGSN